MAHPSELTVVETMAHSLWLHGNWRQQTRHMTTEEREQYADLIESASQKLHGGDDGATVDRWWRPEQSH